MTFTNFVARSAFRNKRRSVLTVLSIAFSLLLLSIMLTVWKSFYIDKGAPDSALRVMTRHKVSLANFLPGYYRDKIRHVPGVVHVVPMTWFGGKYKDDQAKNFFAQFATDPEEYFDVAADKIMPPDQLEAWKRDRAGCVADAQLAQKYGWKIGDRHGRPGRGDPYGRARPREYRFSLGFARTEGRPEQHPRARQAEQAIIS